MSKCKKCNKWGLFLKVDVFGRCDECAEAEDNEWSKKHNLPTRKEIERQQEVLNILNKAREKYKIDKNIDAIIKTYEEVVLIEEVDYPRIGTLYLAELYYKNNELDKAWSHTNWTLLKEPKSIVEVRRLQYKILKKEKKYADALCSLMASFMYESEIYERVTELDKIAFSKQCRVTLRKLKIDTEEYFEYLCFLIDRQIKNKTFDESELRLEVKRLLDELEY